MRIVKKGKGYKEIVKDVVFNYKCGHCDCEFEFSRDDCEDVRVEFLKPARVNVKCPECGTMLSGVSPEVTRVCETVYY